MSDKNLIKQLADRLISDIKVSQVETKDTSSFYLQKLLNIIATLNNNPGIVFHSLLPDDTIGILYVSYWEQDEAQMKVDLSLLQNKLGFSVSFEDSLISVALKLAN